jgi:hypothetical protein
MGLLAYNLNQRKLCRWLLLAIAFLPEYVFNKKNRYTIAIPSPLCQEKPETLGKGDEEIIANP